jgi:hypothetical protein
VSLDHLRYPQALYDVDAGAEDGHSGERGARSEE